MQAQAATQITDNPVRDLNDRARAGTLANARFVFTQTLLSHLTEHIRQPFERTVAKALTQRALIAAAADQEFDPGNDPYGEHDFGAVMHGDQRVLWKIDVYQNDGTFSWGAEDPGNPDTSYRIVTFMLPEDY